MTLRQNIDLLLKKNLDPISYLIVRAKQRLAEEKEKKYKKEKEQVRAKNTKLINSSVEKIVRAVGSLRGEKIEIPKYPDLSPKLEAIKKAIEKAKVDFPEFPDWSKDLKSIEDAIDRIKIPETKTQKVQPLNLLPVERGLSSLLLAIKKQKPTDNKDMVKELKKLGKEIKKIKMGEVEFPNSISIDNFPPTRTPQPVTNININPLRGSVRSTSTTVKTDATPIPGDILTYRRTLTFYNNDANKTLYIGGEDVSIANGAPVPPQSYSPGFDSGPRQLWWGISPSGSMDIRCLEIANEDIGG